MEHPYKEYENSKTWNAVARLITKYSPEGYHDRVYTLDEWTSFYDIGKSFNGSVLTFQEYHEFEKRHIDVVSQLLSETNCRFLTIEYIEIYKDSLIHDLKKSPYNEELLKHIKLFMGMGKGRRIHINLLERETYPYQSA